MNAQPLVQAIKTAVESAGIPFGDAHRPVITDPNSPWVVGWFDAGMVDDRSMKFRDGWSLVGTFHSLGRTPHAARIAAKAVRTAILGLHLSAIDGRTVLMPENLTSLPMQRDDDEQPPLFDVIDEWRIRTTSI